MPTTIKRPSRTLRGRTRKRTNANRPRRKLIRRLTAIMRWQIDVLAPLGYSHRYIASWVFFKRLERVTDDERDCVTAYICREQLHVTDWRNGLNGQAHAFAQKAVLRSSASSGGSRKPKRPAA